MVLTCVSDDADWCSGSVSPLGLLSGLELGAQWMLSDFRVGLRPSLPHVHPEDSTSSSIFLSLFPLLPHPVGLSFLICAEWGLTDWGSPRVRNAVSLFPPPPCQDIWGPFDISEK